MGEDKSGDKGGAKNSLDELQSHMDYSMTHLLAGNKSDSFRQKKTQMDFQMSMEFAKEAEKMEKMVDRFEQGLDDVVNELQETRETWDHKSTVLTGKLPERKPQAENEVYSESSSQSSYGSLSLEGLEDSDS